LQFADKLKSLYIRIYPIAVDEKVPKHHNTHRDCQGEIIRQGFEQRQVKVLFQFPKGVYMSAKKWVRECLIHNTHNKELG